MSTVLVLKPSLFLTSQPPSGMACRRAGSLHGTQGVRMVEKGVKDMASRSCYLGSDVVSNLSSVAPASLTRP